MKQLFLKFFVLVIFLGFFCKGVMAQTSSSASSSAFNSFLPGIGCGNASATDSANKCCYTNIEELKNILIYSVDTSSPSGCLELPIAGRKCVSDFTTELKSGLLNTVVNFPIISGVILYQKQHAEPCVSGEPLTTDHGDASCICVDKNSNYMPTGLCDKYLSGKTEYGQCISCLTGSGIWTGIGCVNVTNMKSFIEVNVFGLGLGLAGVSALLCIIFSAFMMQTSEGNPEKIKKAQERLTSCIIGLVIIIFSVLILRLIGADILKIPQFK